jgi:hypothetical protein
MQHCLDKSSVALDQAQAAQLIGRSNSFVQLYMQRQSG